MQRTLAQKLGLLGLISLASYTLAVLLAPLAYPGYQWMAQAVSDLSADTAPSRILWNQLSSLYMPCGLVCCTLCYLKTGQNTEKHVKLSLIHISSSCIRSSNALPVMPYKAARLFRLSLTVSG